MARPSRASLYPWLNQDEDDEKDIKTVIKQTDDDSPNSITTTVSNRPGRSTYGSNPQALLNKLNEIIGVGAGDSVKQEPQLPAGIGQQQPGQQVPQSPPMDPSVPPEVAVMMQQQQQAGGYPPQASGALPPQRNPFDSTGIPQNTQQQFTGYPDQKGPGPLQDRNFGHEAGVPMPRNPFDSTGIPQNPEGTDVQFQTPWSENLQSPNTPWTNGIQAPQLPPNEKADEILANLEGFSPSQPTFGGFDDGYMGTAPHGPLARDGGWYPEDPNWVPESSDYTAPWTEGIQAPQGVWDPNYPNPQETIGGVRSNPADNYPIVAPTRGTEPPGLSGAKAGDPWTPAAGSTTTAEKAVADHAENEQDSYTVGKEQPNIQEIDALTRTWGKLTYDPKKRRKEYMTKLNKIYQNAMTLQALAMVTGKRSFAGQYTKMAMGKLDAMQKFDSEERLQELTNALYFDREGNYSPPENKADAHAALMQMGASLNEATAIVGHVPAAVLTDDKTFYRYDPEQDKVIARGAPSKSAPDGWGSNDWAQKAAANARGESDTSKTGVDVANAQHLVTQEAILNSLPKGSPERAQQAEYVRTLKSLLNQKGPNVVDLFNKYYGAAMRDGDSPPNKIVGPDGKNIRFNSWEEFTKWWADPSNKNEQSMNSVLTQANGWTPKDRGAVTEVATNATYATAEEAMAAIKEGKHQVNDVIIVGGVEQTVR